MAASYERHKFVDQPRRNMKNVDLRHSTREGRNLKLDRGKNVTARVLLSLDPPNETTRYVDQLALHMPNSVALRYFSWRVAIFGRYDVFHVHWPEFLVRADGAHKTNLKKFLARIFIIRLRLSRTPVIRTLHNLTPHEGVSTSEISFVDSLDSLVRSYIRLNHLTIVNNSRPVVTILHGDYVERFSSLIDDRTPQRAGVLLSIGLIRPYKGVLELIEAVDVLPGQYSLRVVGKPVDPAIQEQIELASKNHPRVSTSFGFVPDKQLVKEILGSEIVVLPYLEIHNSGILLAALSVGRPVLATKSATTEALQSEVGSNWIQLFDGDISGEKIDIAMRAIRNSERSQYPSFNGRTWHAVAQQHATLYWKTLAERPGAKGSKARKLLSKSVAK